MDAATLASMTPDTLAALDIPTVINIFREWGLSPLTGPSGSKSPLYSGSDPRFKPNELYRCRIAHETEDGQFLVLPNDTWQFAENKTPGILIRRAYREHWALIQDHFSTSTMRLFISGSPGTGKSVEGLFILHKIFELRPCPPVVYANSANNSNVLVYYRGLDFQGSDYNAFMTSFAYTIMTCSGIIWHVFDSAAPSAGAGRELAGPQIVITSPGRAQQRDLKPFEKNNSPTYYLPLPTLSEMETMREAFYDDPANERFYISHQDMMKTVDRFGCIPRTVFEFGNAKWRLDMIEAKLLTTSKIEDLLRQVGQSTIDHSVISGSFLHIVPYQRASFESTGSAFEHASPSSSKRPAAEADIDFAGLTDQETIELLKAQYRDIVYVWASDYIRDAAFEQFLFLSADRMMEIILSHTHTSFAGFRWLLLEPFVHKLLSETGVVGRMRNLETGQDLGNVRLGPWKRKVVYTNHSEVDITKGSYNVPHKGNEAAIDSLVPFDGKCFQVTVTGDHGINRPGFDALIKAGVFQDFKRRNGTKNIAFIWMIEASQFESFRKQDFHGKRKKAYAPNSSIRTTYPGLDQFAFEIDLKRIYKFHSGQQRNKRIDMTDNRTRVIIEKAVKAAGLSIGK